MKKMISLSVLLIFALSIYGQTTGEKFHSDKNRIATHSRATNNLGAGGQHRSPSSICSTPTTVPFFEGFESGYTDQDSVMACWKNVDTSGTGNFWISNATLHDHDRTPRTGLWNAYLQYNGDAWLIRKFQLTGGIQYTFDMFARQDNTVDANVEVKFGTDSTIAQMIYTVVPSSPVIDGNYQLFTGTFTPSSSGIYYLGIHGIVGSTPWYLSIDDISLYVPTCKRPTTLTAAGITTTSANLGWTSTGASKWQIQYGFEGFTFGTGTNVVTTANPYTLSSLNSSTAYQFYVRSICGANDTSLWAGPYRFVTLCTDFTTFPYIEGFNTTFPPACWGLFPPTGDSIWQGTFVGIDPDCMPHSGAGMAYYPSYHVEAGTALLITPALDLPSNNFVVKFWMYRDNEPWDDSLQVWYNTAPNLTGATLLGILHRQINSSPAVPDTGWYSYMFNLPGTSAGIGRRILFEGCSDWGRNIFIDDVYLGYTPCATPSALHLVSTTVNSATIDWTSTGNQWRVQYGPAGFTLGSGTKIITTNKPYTITSLPEGCYSVYIQGYCSPADTSDWIGPVSFCLCNSVYTTDYFQGFEGAAFPPLCWSKQITNYNSPSFTWQVTSATPHYEGNRYANVNYDDMSQQDEWLYTPQFNLSGNIKPQLKFAWTGSKYWSVFPYHNCDLNVLVSVNHGAFTQIWNQADVDTTNWTNFDWMLDSISLIPYIAPSVQFAFQYTGLDGAPFSVDAVTVEELHYRDFEVLQNNVSDCDTLGWYHPVITIMNNGSDTILAGGSVPCGYKVNSGPWVNQTFNPPTNILSGNTASFTFSTPYHFNQFTTYNCIFRVTVPGDIDTTNDMVPFTMTFGAINVYLGPDQIICVDDSVTLDAGPGFATYHWSTGASTQSIKLDTAGYGLGSNNFWVAVSSGSCTDTDFIVITFDLCTGIYEVQNTGFRIYPNPSHGVFNLEMDGLTGMIRLDVITLQGKNIYREDFLNNNAVELKRLDLAILPKGIYFISLQNDTHKMIRKLVIE